jgi:hypothetical protein
MAYYGISPKYTGALLMQLKLEQKDKLVIEEIKLRDYKVF